MEKGIKKIRNRIYEIDKEIKILICKRNNIKWYQDFSYSKRISLGNQIIDLMAERRGMNFTLRTMGE